MDTEQSTAHPMAGDWTRSSYSDNNPNSLCVEVRRTAAGSDVRDSKDTGRGRIRVGRAAWRQFIAHVED